MFSAQGTRILDFPSKITLHTANFYIMTLVLCQEACLFLGITRGSNLVSERKNCSDTILNLKQEVTFQRFRFTLSSKPLNPEP